MKIGATKRKRPVRCHPIPSVALAHYQVVTTPIEVNDAVFDTPINMIEEMKYKEKTLGWTDYTDLNVTGSCSCKQNEFGEKFLMVDYNVTWRAHIYLRSFLREGIEYDRPLSQEGVVGHEQQHVYGAIKLVRVNVIDKFLSHITATAENQCQQEVSKNVYFAKGTLNTILAQDYERHSDKRPFDSAFSNEPTSKGRYQYINLRWWGTEPY